jgi:hypothetical protein
MNTNYTCLDAINASLNDFSLGTSYSLTVSIIKMSRASMRDHLIVTYLVISAWSEVTVLFI